MGFQTCTCVDQFLDEGMMIDMIKCLRLIKYKTRYNISRLVCRFVPVMYHLNKYISSTGTRDAAILFGVNFFFDPILNALAAIGVKDIGLMSLCTDHGVMGVFGE